MPLPNHALPEASATGVFVERVDDYVRGRFAAMASPCEVLADTTDTSVARMLTEIAAREAVRVETKLSRYRSDNVIHRINCAAGKPIEVDQETAALIDYATTCWDMSDGLFDITSGVLRRIWKFDGTDRVPTPEAVREVLQHVGWHRVRWERPVLTMPRGMEIDLGGVGKEYAVDRAAALIADRSSCAFVVNFGGDLYASGSRHGDRAWVVGIDDPMRTGEAAVGRIELVRGGLATSGNARRFLQWKGQRLGHILDPRTGWPVEGAPHAVTVLGPSCLEAGTLSTLAYLQGSRAREFLQEQGVQFWVQ